MSNGSDQHEAPILAVLHRAGSTWRALVARVDGPRPEIVATEAFDPDRAAELSGWLEGHGAAEVICILPASSVICRTCSLPDAEPDELEQALQLQAVAHLPGHTLEHRHAAAVLPAFAGETNRSGLLVAWPEEADVDPPPVATPLLYAPDIGALAALLNGDRPTEPLVWLDRADGSVAIALSHANGAVMRATREDPTFKTEWQKSIRRVLAETALSVGHTASFVQTMAGDVEHRLVSLDGQQTALLMPPHMREAAAARVDRVPGDEAWWSEYGVAVGALLARTGELSPLTRLIATPPDDAPTRIKSILDYLGRPMTAVRAVALCALLLMFGPLLVHGLRVVALKVWHPSLDENLAAVEAVKRQRAMYDELDDRAWSMTKLLADLACSTPVGIELEFIRMTHGEAFSVSGRATPQRSEGLSATELIAQMQENLRRTGVFGEINLNWSEPDAYDNYQFDLSGKVVRHARRYEPGIALDYGRWTLAMRQNGEQPPKGGAAAETALASGRVGDAGEEPTALADARDRDQPDRAPVTVAAPADRDDATDDRGMPDRLADAGRETGEPGTDRIAAATPDDSAATDSGRRLPNGRRGGRSVRGGIDDSGAVGAGTLEGRPGAVLPPSESIPELLSADQIAALSVDEARNRLTLVAKARGAVRGDEELQKKLKEQFNLLMARVREGV